MQCANPPLGAGSAGQWVLPRCRTFCDVRGDIHHPVLAISPPFAAPHPQQGCGGGGGGGAGGTQGVAWWTETPTGKPPVPHPRTNWWRGFDASQSFYRPAGGLDSGVPLGIGLPPLGGKGVGEAAALRAQVGVHPPVGIYFWGGVYGNGQEASHEGAVEGLTIIKPLGRAAPATSSTNDVALPVYEP